MRRTKGHQRNDGEIPENKRLKHENQRLRHEVSRLRKLLSRNQRPEKTESETPPEPVLTQRVNVCDSCGKGELEFKVIYKINKPYRYGVCPTCEHRTELVVFDEET